ncbi:unnamed protein product [Ceratitis capitata]|uniref:(Mediterranean fruit fly) hypothetical protein n=1 Tax=Ceratitis capitata TaxID=7213 RepID=A0A811U4M3_CERCA|nr:unnamed protein product [Ceratitis capitata]
MAWLAHQLHATTLRSVQQASEALAEWWVPLAHGERSLAGKPIGMNKCGKVGTRNTDICRLTAIAGSASGPTIAPRSTSTAVATFYGIFKYHVLMEN